MKKLTVSNGLIKNLFKAGNVCKDLKAFYVVIEQRGWEFSKNDLNIFEFNKKNHLTSV